LGKTEGLELLIQRKKRKPGGSSVIWCEKNHPIPYQKEGGKRGRSERGGERNQGRSSLSRKGRSQLRKGEGKVRLGRTQWGRPIKEKDIPCIGRGMKKDDKGSKKKEDTPPLLYIRTGRNPNDIQLLIKRERRKTSVERKRNGLAV